VILPLQDGGITEKSYGKQKIYFIDQSSLTAANPDEIKAMDFQIEEAEKRMKELDKALKEIQSESRKTADSLSTTDLLKAVEDVS